MGKLRLEETIKLILYFMGNDDTYQFINSFDIAVNLTEELLIKYLNIYNYQIKRMRFRNDKILTQ